MEHNTSPKSFDERIMDRFLAGCAIIGRDWRYLYVNDSAAKRDGKKREDMIGKTVFEVMPGIEKSDIFVAYKNCMEKRKSENLETPIVSSDGIIRWYRFDFEPMDEGIFVASVEITEQKKLEEDLRRKEIELNDAERMAKVGNWLAIGLDPSHSKVTWSKELSRLAHRDPETFVPTLAAQMDLFVPEDAKRLAAAVVDSTNTGVPYDLELQLKEEEGRETKWVESRGEALRDTNGKIIGLHGTA